MKMLDRVLGFATDPERAARLHDLSHYGKVEYLMLSREDAQRKRLRATTDKGTECLIKLSRDQRLDDGAVLELSDRAIVVRMTDERWLALEASDETAALELGYFCGNLHWRVRFQRKSILVAIEGPEKSYLERLQHLISSGKVKRMTND
jgi:urease accessory protein